MTSAQMKWMLQLGMASITVVGLIEQGKRSGWL